MKNKKLLDYYNKEVAPTINRIIEEEEKVEEDNVSLILNGLGEDQVLAIYERGSALLRLDNEYSDVDLMVIVRAKKKDFLNLTNYGNSIKLKDGLIDLLIIDEYRFISLLRKSIFNVSEPTFFGAIYVHDDYYDTETFIHDNALELLLSSPESVIGSMRGWTISYKLDEYTHVGQEIKGKKLAMAYRGALITDFMLSKEFNEIPSLVRLDSEMRELLRWTKRLSVIESEDVLGTVQVMKSYVDKIMEESLEKIKSKEVMELREKTEYYIDKLLEYAQPLV